MFVYAWRDFFSLQADIDPTLNCAVNVKKIGLCRKKGF